VSANKIKILTATFMLSAPWFGRSAHHAVDLLLRQHIAAWANTTCVATLLPQGTIPLE
jgi:hypothetical protein